MPNPDMSKLKDLPHKPAIPEPYADVASLYATVLALKEAVEILTHQRGSIRDAAATWGELVKYNIISFTAMPPEKPGPKPFYLEQPPPP